MGIEDYKIKVKLLEEAIEDQDYEVCESNPAINSDYECEGSLTSIFHEDDLFKKHKDLSYIDMIMFLKECCEDPDGDRDVEVLWDNGYRNVYALKDLLIMEKQYKSIW